MTQDEVSNIGQRGACKNGFAERTPIRIIQRPDTEQANATDIDLAQYDNFTVVIASAGKPLSERLRVVFSLSGLVADNQAREPLLNMQGSRPGTQERHRAAAEKDQTQPFFMKTPQERQALRSSLRYQSETVLPILQQFFLPDQAEIETAPKTSIDIHSGKLTLVKCLKGVTPCLGAHIDTTRLTRNDTLILLQSEQTQARVIVKNDFVKINKNSSNLSA